MFTPQRAIVAVTGLLAISVLSAVLGSEEIRAVPDPRIAYTDDRSHRAGLAGLDTPSEIAAAIAKRYGGARVLSAGTTDPPSVPGVRKGVWLSFEVAVVAGDERSIRPQWEADLVQGAVADALAASATPRLVAGSRIHWRLPNGALLRDMGGGMGDIVPGQNFSTDGGDAIRQALIDGLARVRLRPLSIEVLHADQPSPAVVAETSDPHQAARDAAETVRTLFGRNPPLYEGYYFEIRDAAGEPVVIQSASFRTGAGRLWVGAAVARDSSLVHG